VTTKLDDPDLGAVAPPPAPALPAVEATPPAPAAQPEPVLRSGGWAMHAPEEPSPIPKDALLEATRLAVAGTDRAAIAAVLKADYGIEDPDPVVDRVLGPR
jgi:hypothetical protein